jgi:hypothetical protein
MKGRGILNKAKGSLRLHVVPEEYYVRPVWVAISGFDTGGHWVSSAPDDVHALAQTPNWRPAGTSEQTQTLLASVVEHEAALLDLDPWIPFPQLGCYGVFGDDARPLPIGALSLLWKSFSSFTGRCVPCGGRSYGYSVSGILQVAGVSACCIDCGARSQLSLGNGAQCAKAIASHLRHSEFYLRAVWPRGGFPCSAQPLIRAMHTLGHSAASLEQAWGEVKLPAFGSIDIPAFPNTIRKARRAPQIVR